jgi:hypothetical protein
VSDNGRQRSFAERHKNAPAGVNPLTHRNAQAARHQRWRQVDIDVLLEPVLVPDLNETPRSSAARSWRSMITTLVSVVPRMMIDKSARASSASPNTCEAPRGRRAPAPPGPSTVRRILPQRSGTQLADAEVLNKLLVDPDRPAPMLLLEPPPVRERCALAFRSTVGKKPARACATIHFAG